MNHLALLHTITLSPDNYNCINSDWVKDNPSRNFIWCYVFTKHWHQVCMSPHILISSATSFFVNWLWWVTITHMRLDMLLMIFPLTLTLPVVPYWGHMGGGYLVVSLMREKSNDPTPFRPYGRGLHLHSGLPCQVGTPNKPPCPGCYHPRFPLDAPFPIPYKFHFPSPPYALLSPSIGRFLPIPNPLHMGCQFSLPLKWHDCSPHASYDSHNFPPPCDFESVTDSESDSPLFPDWTQSLWNPNIPLSWLMTLTPRVRFPAWSPSHQIFVADYATIMSTNWLINSLAEEAKVFQHHLAAEASHT